MPASALMNVDGRRRPQGGAQPRARLRRGRAAPGLGQGPRQLRLGGRPPGRGDHLQRAVQGAPRLRLPDGGARHRSPGADKTHRWIVDPLDGTTNFLHGIPLFAISIGLERDGQLVAGVIYNPVKDELFTAEKGKGAFLNDRRLRVAARRIAGRCLVTTGIPHRGRGGHDALHAEMQAVMREVAGIRRTGSAALDLAWVAAGRFDAYWEHNLKPWDMAAGIVIVREAGGIVTDCEGGQTHARDAAASSRPSSTSTSVVGAAAATAETPSRGRWLCDGPGDGR